MNKRGIETSSILEPVGSRDEQVRSEGREAQDPRDESPADPRIRAAIAELGLTFRESQIVEHFAIGHSTDQLARALYISTATVRTHLRKIFTTLQISSRVELLSLVLAKVLEHLEEDRINSRG